jgi:hypothetical protein
LEALVGNVSDFIEKNLNWWKEMMEHGWLTDIIRYMIFDLLWLGRTNKWLWGNDCGGLVMTELSYPKARWKIDLEEISARSDWYGWRQDW